MAQPAALNCRNRTAGFQPARFTPALTPTQARPTHTKGFTLLTTLVAMSVLAVLIAGICASLAGAARHRRVLWEEVQARELAVSAIEHSVAAHRITFTPAGGETVNVAALLSNEPTPLSEVEIHMFIEPAKDSPTLRQITVEVSWRSGADGETTRKVKHGVVQ